jgi:hypothetical protein
MINRYRLSFWLLLVSLILVSCNQGSNPYRSQQSYQASDGINKSEEVLSLDKDLPVLRKMNLQTLTIGKNRIEIEQLMGPPEGKSLDGGNGYLWDYRRPVYDEASDQVYGWSLISFKFLKGLCSTVNVRLEHLPVQLANPDLGSEEQPELPK